MKRILVIEDVEVQSKLIRSILEKRGYEVITAKDGVEGLKRVRESRPDLVVLDTVMPKMGGLSVCGLLKNNAATRDIPVVILSARKTEEDEKLYSQVKADAFLPKPVDNRELAETVSRFLGSPDPSSVDEA
jgi:CheY-like chemotaxis protein